MHLSHNVGTRKMANASDPRHPLFYAATFLTDQALGIIDPQNAPMGSLIGSMEDACRPGATFDPVRCSLLAGAVGRARTLDACGAGGLPSAGYVAPVPLRQQPLVSGTAALSAMGPAPPQVTPSTITAALAAVGAGPKPSILTACGTSLLSKVG